MVTGGLVLCVLVLLPFVDGHQAAPHLQALHGGRRPGGCALGALEGSVNGSGGGELIGGGGMGTDGNCL